MMIVEDTFDLDDNFMEENDQNHFEMEAKKILNPKYEHQDSLNDVLETISKDLDAEGGISTPESINFEHYEDLTRYLQTNSSATTSPVIPFSSPLSTPTAPLLRPLFAMVPSPSVTAANPGIVHHRPQLAVLAEFEQTEKRPQNIVSNFLIKKSPHTSTESTPPERSASAFPSVARSTPSVRFVQTPDSERPDSTISAPTPTSPDMEDLPQPRPYRRRKKAETQCESYREKRKRNNIAVRKSRAKAKDRQTSIEQEYSNLKKKIKNLSSENDKLKNQNVSLREMVAKLVAAEAEEKSKKRKIKK